MAFSFVHIADIHMDTPFKSKDSSFRALLRDEIRQTFKSCVDFAISQSVDALLIAGDLFDSSMLSFTSEKFLVNEFNRLNEANIKVLYALGNHDPYNNGTRLKNIVWPSNVHVFCTSHPEAYRFFDESGNTTAVVYGAGHEREKESRNLIEIFPQAEGNIPHIGLAHVFVSGVKSSETHERYAPCLLSDLIEKKYAYWALGHVHRGIVLSEEPLVVYPGNLVGRNNTEEGAKGAYLIEIDNSGRVEAEFYSLTKIMWTAFNVDKLDNCKDLSSLEQWIIVSISEQLQKNDYRLMVKIVLKGPCPLRDILQDEKEIETLSEYIKTYFGFEFVELTSDEITPSIDIDRFRNGPHVLNTALSLLDRMSEDDELLLNLISNDKFAGFPANIDNSEKLKYLRTLIKDMEYEIADRLVGGDSR